jgi:hypothetical protein
MATIVDSFAPPPPTHPTASSTRFTTPFPPRHFTRCLINRSSDSTRCGKSPKFTSMLKEIKKRKRRKKVDNFIYLFCFYFLIFLDYQSDSSYISDWWVR